MATTETFTGANASGSSGANSRTLTLSNTSTTIQNGFEVIVVGLYLHLTTDYTVSHNASSTVITFVNSLWNDQQIAVIYDTGAATTSTGAAGILPLDTQIFNNEIAYFGDTITLRVVTDDSYSDYGDSTESVSDSSIKAIVNDFTVEEIKQSEGILRGDSKRFFIQNTATTINEGNRIIFDSITYEVVKVVEGKMAGNTYIIEAWCNKT